ncbi:MAG: ferric reductase-like transmembrane domain-containing protein [Bordetella sp.]|jgi:sulfoxide reductase heme-binding subunit YedZ
MPSRLLFFIRAWTFEGITSLLTPSLQAWAALPLLVGIFVVLGSIDLGANPQESIIRGLGQASLVLLVFAYAITSIERLWQRLVRQLGRKVRPFGLVTARRAVGLWALAYAALHLLAYWLFEQDGNTRQVVVDFFRRPFVTVGIVALLMMLALGITSNRFSMTKLGPVWKQLHRLIGLIVALSILHYVLHKAGKNDFAEPIAFSLVAILAWLLKRQRQTP